jgi:hypothetical protein
MSTLAEIEKAIESLPAREMEALATWLDGRRKPKCVWPVPPPDVPRTELERIETDIDAAFPMRRG